jgi:integrase
MLTKAVESYIAVRRATGFAFRSEGSLLQSFAAFSEAAGKHYVCSETAIQWAGSAPLLSTRARRLGQVIRFARYIRAEDPHHETPPAVFGSESRPRPVPYIYSSDEIQRILQAASELGKRNTFRKHTYQTFFALLACTGLRVSEAIHLCFQDITADGLVIRCSKFRKSRLVPTSLLRSGEQQRARARVQHPSATTLAPRVRTTEGLYGRQRIHGLWRLARVTQWCSVGVTHAENGTGNEMWKGRRHPRRRRAHGGIGEAGDIIHAAGVRVAVSSSASQARTVNGGEETGWICLP